MQFQRLGRAEEVSAMETALSILHFLREKHPHMGTSTLINIVLLLVSVVLLTWWRNGVPDEEIEKMIKSMPGCVRHNLNVLKERIGECSNIGA